MIDKESLTAWHPVGPGMPLHAWLETRREGEDGVNVCCARIMCLGDDVEWVEKESGRTTITHSTFAPPTHWRFVAPESQTIKLT